MKGGRRKNLGKADKRRSGKSESWRTRKRFEAAKRGRWYERMKEKRWNK